MQRNENCKSNGKCNGNANTQKIEMSIAIGTKKNEYLKVKMANGNGKSNGNN